ncbi:MAG: nicotinamide-nucleotide amidohydrolase family protein [Steroidobacteraceae bacterium]
MADERKLAGAVQELAARLRARGARLVTAESCTGGWIAKACTDLAGSSQWFECGYVTYSNAAKTRDLGVAAEILAQHGAVSGAVVDAMLAGALSRSGAAVGIAVSGVAGPDGGSADKPVGTVWFAVGGAGDIVASHEQLPGDREAIRRRTVELGVRKLVEWLDQHRR